MLFQARIIARASVTVASRFVARGVRPQRRPSGSIKPRTATHFRGAEKVELTAAPVLVSDLPTVPLKKFDMKSLLPKTASPTGPFSPVMKLGLIAAPMVASYSPMVPVPKFDTKRVLPFTARKVGAFSPV